MTRVRAHGAHFASNENDERTNSRYTQSGKRDSNPRPQPWQGCALPTELFPHTTPGSRLATEPNYTRDVSRGTLPSILSTRRSADRSTPDLPRQWRRGESNP